MSNTRNESYPETRCTSQNFEKYSMDISPNFDNILEISTENRVSKLRDMEIDLERDFVDTLISWPEKYQEIPYR